MSGPLKATVVVPTSIDRGPLLPYSVGSILNQSVAELEVFIMGDGVYDSTRDAIRRLQKQDSRVRFFDHPKHIRRGEENRHQALQEARGEIVCYLCDRDLMMPNHVATMLELLGKHDFASTLPISVRPNGELTFGTGVNYFGSLQDQPAGFASTATIPLSCAAHTLDMYRRLPHGWRTTPPEVSHTDRYMWQQFLDAADCKAISHHEPSILYFKREDHPGWPLEKRLPELQHWSEHLNSEQSVEALRQTATRGVLQEVQSLREDLQTATLLWGRTPRALVLGVAKKLGIK